LLIQSVAGAIISVYEFNQHTVNERNSKQYLGIMPTPSNHGEFKSNELVATGSPEMDGAAFEELMKERTRVG
jgi:hypothetical protein